MNASRRLSLLHSYSIAVAAVAAALSLSLAAESFAGVANVYLLFLTAVIGIAVRHGLGPALLGSFLSVLACNFFFLPPLYTLFVAEPANILTLGLFSVVALFTSNLAARARDEALTVRARAESTEALYSFSRNIAGVIALPDLLITIVRQVESMLPIRASLLLSDGRGGYEAWTPLGYADQLEPFEADALRAAYPAGDGTFAGPRKGRSLLRLGNRYVLPLSTSHGVIGLVALSPIEVFAGLQREERRLLQTLLVQAAVAIERVKLAEDRDRAQLAVETERLRSAVLASLSHDLRTPLASILGAVTALRSEPDLYDAAARDDLTAMIQEEAERLTRFVANLLDMTRLETGTIALDRQPVHIEEVVGTALRRVGSSLASVRVMVDLASDLPMLNLDVVLFEQVLVNLLENAGKFSPSGSLVRVEGRQAADTIKLVVEDDGPGIAGADLPHIFEKFYRAQQGDLKRAGTGLGLAICRGFVEALGGSIEAANRVGTLGAVFTITFPSTTFSKAVEELEP